ncbi:MAG: DNA polymerase I [Flavobacteriales bacterium]|jgi:DNA polymerase-1|nr:DNA polymerase I [Flavobacteriales bacterium]
MENQKEKFFILDAFALIYRSYFAFAKNPRISSKGENTSAVFGFMNTLLDVLEKENPKYIGVAFDTSGPTFRHEQYEAYKANREAMPEGIQVAIPRIFSLLDAMKIPVIKKPGFEADDIVGTLAWEYAREDLDIFMMTPDKDYAQLIRPNVFMYKPARMGKGVEIWGEDEVREKFGVKNCIEVIDFLAMMGDSSDNIPGIPGVGEKTAKKLLALYNNLDGLYENVEELKGKQKEKVIANKELAYLSKELATIKTDVPHEFKLEDFLREEYDKTALSSLFKELEFYSSAKRLQISLSDVKNGTIGSKGIQTQKTKIVAQPDLFSQFETETEDNQDITETPNLNTASYKIIENDEMLNEMIEYLFKYKKYAFQLDTSSLNPIDAEIVGISFSAQAGNAFYLPFPENQEECKVLLRRIKPILSYNWIKRFSFKMKYDIQVFRKYDILLGDNIFDTEIAHYLLEPDMKHDLERLAGLYLNQDLTTLEELVGKKSFKDVNFRDIDQEARQNYGLSTVDAVCQIGNILEEKIKDQKLQKLFEEIEMPLVKVLATIEWNGVHLDTDNLTLQSKKLSAKSTELSKEIIEMAGEDFNIASPKQLGVILFDKLQLDAKAKKTKSGQYSTAEPVLLKLKAKHPIIEKILEFRGVQKLLSTYVDALPKLIHPETQKIHTNYRQTVAATGRLSSTNPNLQNIPVRTEDGRKVREAFVPRTKNRVLLAADYSQIELRLIAHMSQDPEMIKAFNEGSDFHASTASRLFNVPLDEVTRTYRSYAKTVNFGIIYGVSAFGLSEQTDLSRKESKELIQNYYNTFPRLKEYIGEMVNTARDTGFVETIFNRRRILRDIHSRNAVVRAHAERNAVNAPVQGSAADLIKIAMIEIQKVIEKEQYDALMILQVHDELVFDVSEEIAEDFAKKIQEVMEGVLKLSIPLIVDVNEGQNWLEAH